MVVLGGELAYAGHSTGKSVNLFQVINRGWLMPEEIKDYNNWVRRNEIDHVCDEYLPPLGLGYAAHNSTGPSGVRGDTTAYSPGWFERLLIWAVLCALTCAGISMLRRVYRNYSDQPYTVILDDDAAAVCEDNTHDNSTW